MCICTLKCVYNIREMRYNYYTETDIIFEVTIGCKVSWHLENQCIPYQTVWLRSMINWYKWGAISINDTLEANKAMYCGKRILLSKPFHETLPKYPTIVHSHTSLHCFSPVCVLYNWQIIPPPVSLTLPPAHFLNWRSVWRCLSGYPLHIRGTCRGTGSVESSVTLCLG